VRALVRAVPAQLSRPGRNEAGTGPARRSSDDLPLGEASLLRNWKLESRRNVHHSPQNLDVSVSSGRLGISNTLEFLLSPTRDAQAAKRFARQSAAYHRWFSSSNLPSRGAGSPTHACD